MHDFMVLNFVRNQAKSIALDNIFIILPSMLYGSDYAFETNPLPEIFCCNGPQDRESFQPLGKTDMQYAWLLFQMSVRLCHLTGPGLWQEGKAQGRPSCSA